MEKFEKMLNFRDFFDCWNSKNWPGNFVFQNLKNPHGKNLDLWVRIQFVQKEFAWGITDSTEADF